MNLQLWQEFLQDSKNIDLSSLELKDRLNEDIWLDDGTLKPELSEKLTDIAKVFFNSLKLPDDAIKDIIITGSLANYNWSKYSDIDLQILMTSTRTSNLSENTSGAKHQYGIEFMI